jgi:hypothetical protein
MISPNHRQPNTRQTLATTRSSGNATRITPSMPSTRTRTVCVSRTTSCIPVHHRVTSQMTSTGIQPRTTATRAHGRCMQALPAHPSPPTLSGMRLKGSAPKVAPRIPTCNSHQSERSGTPNTTSRRAASGSSSTSATLRTVRPGEASNSASGSNATARRQAAPYHLHQRSARRVPLGARYATRRPHISSGTCPRTHVFEHRDWRSQTAGSVALDPPADPLIAVARDPRRGSRCDEPTLAGVACT